VNDFEVLRQVAGVRELLINATAEVAEMVHTATNMGVPDAAHDALADVERLAASMAEAVEKLRRDVWCGRENGGVDALADRLVQAIERKRGDR